MARIRDSFLIGLLALTFLSSVAVAQDNVGKSENQKLWDDFIHYCTIVRLPMAISKGKSLADLKLSPVQLMEVIENGENPDWEIILSRTRELRAMDPDRRAQAKELRGIADNIAEQIRTARLKLARKPERIRRAIVLLSGTAQQRLQALERLKAAGQFASTEMVRVLLSSDEEDKKLHPWVILAMMEVGRPLVVPLGESLDYLPSQTQQEVARVLAHVRYPVALPYLARAAANPKTDPHAREVMEQAIRVIADHVAVPVDMTPEYLFLLLAEDYYAHRESLIIEPDEDWNAVWYANKDGLPRYMKIPTPIFFDVMSMRLSRFSLMLNQDYSAAFSLWIASNFRRAYALKTKSAGEEDPSYEGRQSPQFYARLAGPRHLHPVLARALQDHDPQLARDTIAALSSICGESNLLNIRGQENQPLLAALVYPERRVRYEAALAIAKAMPTTPFSGAQRVIPVLVDATRAGTVQNAMIIAPQETNRNALRKVVDEATRMQAYIAPDMVNALEQIDNLPGVDLLVLRVPTPVALNAYRMARENFKLQSTPIVFIAESDDYHPLNRAFSSATGVDVVESLLDEDELAKAVTAAVQGFTGKPMSPKDELKYAQDALAALKEIAITQTPVFNILDGQPGLEQALMDKRPEVAIGASQVLALMPAEDIQQKIADAALNETRPENIRIEQLKSLAQSAKLYGPLVSDSTHKRLLTVVDNAFGELADAAAEAHGALNLPTAAGVNLIVKQPEK